MSRAWPHLMLAVALGALVAACGGATSPSVAPSAAVASAIPSAAAIAPTTAAETTPSATAGLATDPAAATLRGYLPQAWWSSCVRGQTAIENVRLTLTCSPPNMGIVITLTQYIAETPISVAVDEYMAYLAEFSLPDGTPGCIGQRLDGPLVVGGRTIGMSGGCTDGDFFAFRVDADRVEGNISANSFADARAWFVQIRLLPRADSGTISGAAFGPPAPEPTPPTFAALRAQSKVLTYSGLVHDSAALQGAQVYFKGEVLQYTTDTSIPFSVLVDVTRGTSGLYIGGPIALTGYMGKPLAQGDGIEFVGIVTPMVTYESIGGSKTIPTVDVVVLRISP